MAISGTMETPMPAPTILRRLLNCPLSKTICGWRRARSQAASEPRNVVPGMGFSPDKMLQGRLISYPDAHRYRLGANYDSLPVNKPQCPYHTYNKDGAMRFDGNGGSAVNYEPNSFGGPTQDRSYVEWPRAVSGTVARHDHRTDGDYYTQPGNLFRLLSADAKAAADR